jgi:superfamily II DNA or RNA helicase
MDGFLVMPISWSGTLQQYVGRLHRLHDSKREVIAHIRYATIRA